MLSTSVFGLLGLTTLAAALPVQDPPTTLVTVTKPYVAVSTSEPLTTSPASTPDFNDIATCIGSCIDLSYSCLKTAGPEECANDFHQCKKDCFEAAVPEPVEIPESQPAKRQWNQACIDQCLAQWGICIIGDHAIDYCDMTANACYHACNANSPKDRIEPKPVVIPESQPVKRQVWDPECTALCLQHYDVCLAGGHAETYCAVTANAWYHGCVPGIAKEAEVSKRQIVPPASPVRKQCVSNCRAQYDICIKGGHDRQYCREITNKCIDQCPDSAAKEENEKISKRQTPETIAQCIRNCRSQILQCENGGFSTEFCQDLSDKCVDQCIPGKVARRSQTPECDQCDVDWYACLETAAEWNDALIQCVPTYQKCQVANNCLPPSPAEPTVTIQPIDIPVVEATPAPESEPAKRAATKDCQECERDLQTCIDNRGPFQPLDQTCGFPYRQCLATCTPPPPPAPVKRAESVDCGVCDSQAKFCMDSRGPAIHALDIICGIPHRQCLATCTRPHSNTSVCVKNGIEFEC